MSRPMSRTALPIGLLAPGIGARRNLVLLIATFGLIGSSSYAGAQPHKPAKIGLLFGGTLASRPQIDGFFQGLRDLGYVDGKNVSIEVRESLGQAERLPQQALELVALQPDVLVASSTPAALAAQKATRSIPVVMTLVSNAVELGLARSLAHPGGNITGVSVNTVELSRKRVQFAKELMPSASGIALLSNSQNKANASMVDEVKAAAKALKLNVRLIEFVGQGDLSTVLSKPVREPLLLLMNDPVIFDRRETVARFAIANRIATLATYPDEADEIGRAHV